MCIAHIEIRGQLCKVFEDLFYYYYYLFIHLSFGDNVSLCSLGYLGTCFVDQTVFCLFVCFLAKMIGLRNYFKKYISMCISITHICVCTVEGVGAIRTGVTESFKLLWC